MASLVELTNHFGNVAAIAKVEVEVAGQAGGEKEGFACNHIDGGAAALSHLYDVETRCSDGCAR
jgi:hypothetical protein